MLVKCVIHSQALPSPCCDSPAPEDAALASVKAKLPSWVPGAATISRYCAQAQPATESSPRD